MLRQLLSMTEVSNTTHSGERAFANDLSKYKVTWFLLDLRC